MRDPAGVGAADRVGERDGHVEEPIERQTLLRDQLRERSSVDQFHRDEALVLRLLDAVDRDDVGVFERGHRLGFALEAPALRGIPGRRLGQDLERNVAFQLAVTGSIHVAHAAGSQLLQDLVLIELLADHDPGRKYNPMKPPERFSTPAEDSLAATDLRYLSLSRITREDRPSDETTTSASCSPAAASAGSRTSACCAR